MMIDDAPTITSDVKSICSALFYKIFPLFQINFIHTDFLVFKPQKNMYRIGISPRQRHSFKSHRTTDLISNKNKFIVVIPPAFFCIDTWFWIAKCSGCARPTATGQPEALLAKHIECLFDETVLEKKS